LENSLLLLLSANFGTLDTTIQKIVYREFYTLVYRPIMYMVKDHEATEDIIQEAFLKVVKNIPPIENEVILKGWIKVVAKNTTYNYIRKNKRNRNEIDIESVFINESLNYASDIDSIEVEVELKALFDFVSGYLNDLKPEFRVLMEMRWKQDLSYKEIAVELDITEETVKYKLHRARDAVKKRFMREWREDNGEKRI
jgi:RNA polymerase sigma-70 factor (ECF subfamily)